MVVSAVVSASVRLLVLAVFYSRFVVAFDGVVMNPITYTVTSVFSPTLTLLDSQSIAGTVVGNSAVSGVLLLFFSVFIVVKFLRWFQAL